jgi:putative membrane protein
MKVRARDFASSAEKKKIRQAVQDAEKGTSGDIAVMVVDASDRYREAELIGGLFFAALLSLVLSLWFHYITIWFYIPVTCLLVFPGIALFRRFPHMKLAFLGRARIEEEVRERAVYAFFQKGVHKTEEETGILIFISLLERKVWILGDRGIHAKIAPDFWRSLAKELVDGIKGDRPLDALCTVIEKCGVELARHFPNRGNRTNQLEDDLIF